MHSANNHGVCGPWFATPWERFQGPNILRLLRRRRRSASHCSCCAWAYSTRLHHRTQLRRPFLGEGATCLYYDHDNEASKCVCAEGAVRRLLRQQGLERERHISTLPLLPGPGRNLHPLAGGGRHPRRRDAARPGPPRALRPPLPRGPGRHPQPKTPAPARPGPPRRVLPRRGHGPGPLRVPRGRPACGLLAVTVDDADADGGPRLLASFHGDSDGLATCPVLGALDAAARAAFPRQRASTRTPTPAPSPSRPARPAVAGSAPAAPSCGAGAWGPSGALLPTRPSAPRLGAPPARTCSLRPSWCAPRGGGRGARTY
jgi:hypothetical protein